MKYLFTILLLISFTCAQEKLDISFHIDSIDFQSGFARSSINVAGLVAMKNTCNDKVNWTETLSIDKHNPIKKDVFKINVQTADDTALDFCFLVCSGPIRKRQRLSIALDRAASDATNRGVAHARQLIAEGKLRRGGNISIARHLLQELQGIQNSFVQNPKITFLGRIVETTRIRFAAFRKARVIEKSKTFKVKQGKITIKYRIIIVKKHPEPKFDLKVKISQIRCTKTRGRGSDNILILGGITRNKHFDFVFGVPTTMRDGMKTNFPDTPTGHVTTLKDLKPNDDLEIGLVFFKENTPKDREMRNEVANQIFHKMKVSRGNISVVNASIKGLKTAQQPNADRVLGKYTRTTKMKNIQTTTQKWVVESSKPGGDYKYTIRIQYIKITRK